VHINAFGVRMIFLGNVFVEILLVSKSCYTFVVPLSLDLKRIWNPIDFQGQRSRSQGLIFRRGDTPRFALPFFIYLTYVSTEEQQMCNMI
jgi:hypothetical protein